MTSRHIAGMSLLGVMAFLAACGPKNGPPPSQLVILRGNSIGDYLDKRYGIWIAGHEFPDWITVSLPENASAAEALALTRKALKCPLRAQITNSHWLHPLSGWFDVIGATGDSAQSAIETVHDYKLDEVPGTGGTIFALSPALLAPTAANITVKFPALSRANISAMRDASVSSVLKPVADRSGFVILADPQSILISPHRLDLPKDMPAAECVEWLNTELAAIGFAFVLSSTDRPILNVVSSHRAKVDLIPCRYESDPTKIPQTDELVTQIIPLRYFTAEEAKDLAQELRTFSGREVYVRHNCLFATDSSASMHNLADLTSGMELHIKEWNAAIQPATRTVALVHARAEDVAKVVNLRYSPPPPPPSPRTTGGGSGSSGAGPLVQVWPPTHATTNTRANTLTINGPTGKVDEVLAAIHELDQDAGR